MTDEQQTPDEENVTADVAAEGDEPITEDSEAAAYLAKLEEAETARDELAERLADTIRERDSALAEADEHRPWADVSIFMMETADDVYKRFGEEAIRDLAQIERVKVNRERSKNGHFPLPELDGDELDRAIQATVADLLADTERAMPPVEGPLNRVLKMVDKEGNLRQIPYEPQVNNMAGSLADGYERYRLKGFKMTRPLLCATQDCYKPAAVNEAGELAFRAYCSKDHENRTERDSTQTEVPGITNRNVLSGV